MELTENIELVDSITPSSCDENDTLSNDSEKDVSKREKKRLNRMERLKEGNKEKRKKERINKKLSIAKRKEEGQEMGPSRKALKKNTMDQSECKQKIVIDCSFDEVMHDREINSLSNQIQHCYGSNRRAQNPMQFYLTHFHGRLKAKLEGFGHYKNWDLNIKEESFNDVFDKKDLVYLSSESSNVLEKLDEEKIYIIGGLVDHNHHKGMCFELAVSQGIAHAQLPIDNFLELKSRKVLAINHVFDILLKFTETSDWKESLNTVIPTRKGAIKKDTNIVLSEKELNSSNNTDSDNSINFSSF